MSDFVPYTDLTWALVADLFVLASCTILLLMYARLTHSHPAVIYLVFHIVVVTSRSAAILVGAETLFSRWSPFFDSVTPEEILRAVFFADAALVAMTIAWIQVSFADLKTQERKLLKEKFTTPPLSATVKEEKQPVTLSARYIWGVVAIAFPIGVVSLIMLGNIPGVEKTQLDLGEWQESSWLAVTMTWAGLSLLALIYWYGFRWWLLGAMSVYLLIMSVQGYHRFRIVIPLILLLQIFLDRRGKKWPPAYVLAPIVAGMLLFYPLKSIGRMVQEGASITQITEISSTAIREAAAGQHDDQMLLDVFAAYLTLIDDADRRYYGSTYLVLFVAPVPRQWWADKPTQSAHLFDVSTTTRPMGEMGMALSYIGEFYINFGFIGVIVLAYLLAYILARIYFRAYRSHYYSVLRFSYLLIACNLIQVYRDGLISLFIFTLVNMMPLSIIVFLHWIKPLHKKSSRPLIQVITPVRR
ncbi:MAG: O-antigen polysaccharide polymerase Wzy [Acidobacteriota bacterium]